MARSRRGRGEGGVYQLPSGNWQAVLPGRKKAGRTKTFPTKQEAAEWRDEHRRQKAAPAGTVAEWLDQWLALVKADKAPKTYRHDAQKVARWLKPRLGPVRLRDLTGVRVKGMLADMAAGGHSDSERQKAGSVLRKALNAAVDMGVLAANPMVRVRLPTPKRPEKRVFTPAELGDLVAAAEARGWGHWVRLWADAGVRPGELLGLLWDDVDPAACAVSIRRSLDADTHELRPPKTKKSRRTLDVDAATMAALELARPADWKGKVLVPDSRGGHWWESNFADKVWSPLLAAAGLAGRGFTPYTLRHTMATLLIRAGVPLKVVSERLVHEDVTTTLRSYAHVMEGDQKAAAAAMGNILRKARLRAV